MFGLSFLFAGALLALPLAGAPVVLHLLFRRKSPVVPFSTLRFVRASMQKTAARRRVQQWLLLAARVLLLALLIWAIAQPAQRLASRWGSHGGSTVAAIVIDNSYSMMLQQNHVTRLEEADDAVQDLLRGELRGAKVAIFKTLPPADGKPEPLLPASEILEQWTPLKTSPAPHPLADRVADAAALLDREQASDKWLIVVTDLQSREFPRPLPAFDGANAGENSGGQSGRFVLLDLHPDDPHNVGITSIALDPPQPIPGTLADAVVDVVGKAGDTRACSVSIIGLDGQERFKSAPTMAALDAGGRLQLRFPIRLPAEKFVQVKAQLSGDDDLPWDDSRTLLVGIPPRQTVHVIVSQPSAASRAITLALDPTEGHDPSWPIELTNPAAANPAARSAVVVATQWPSASEAHELLDLAGAGGGVVLCLSPGLESSWASLPAEQKEALAALLPSAPVVSLSRSGSVVNTAEHDPLLNGLTDDHGAFPPGHVRAFVPFLASASAPMLLGVEPEESSGRPQGVLFRKAIGRGAVYTLGTLPDALDSNLATSPAFLPLMVRMCLPQAGDSAAQNIELGQPIVYAAPAPSSKRLTLQTPDGAAYSMPATATGGASGAMFRFDGATTPGLYTWHAAGQTDAIAAANVQLPAAESELIYRPADQVAPPGSNVIVARSLAELRSRSQQLAEPEPHWSGPVAIVLLLICLESLMASTKGLWKPIWPWRWSAIGSRVIPGRFNSKGAAVPTPR